MFDSLINSKFYNRCKHAFKCIRTRLVIIRRKKRAMIGFLKKDVAELLSNGHATHAFRRMDALIIEMNHASCYNMIEEYCDLLGKQLSSLQKQRECPQESREAVSTLIFAAARFPDLPELCDLRHIFTGTYGSFEPFISYEFVRKLQHDLFTNEEKFQVMQSIAQEFSVGFDKKALEIELWAPSETKDDFLEKDPVKNAELAMPLPIKQTDDVGHPLERKSEATPVGHKQKVEAGSIPKDVQAAPAVDFGRLNGKNGRNNSDKSHAKEESEKLVSPLDMKSGNTQKDENAGRRHADKPNGKEHFEKSVSPLDTKSRDTQTQVHKLKKKNARPSEKELMEAVELDIDGLPKDGSSSVKNSQTESKKIVSPIIMKEAEKEHGVEKENYKGPGYQHRSPMSGRPDYNRRHANTGCKTLGQQKEGPSSLNPSSGKTANKPPPYAKPNGAKVKNCDEKEESNSFLHGRPQQLEDLGHTVKNGHRAANMRPYVNPKFGIQPLTDEAPEKITSQTPSSHRRPPTKHKDASDAYDENRNGGGNCRNLEKAPISRPSHSGRRNRALYMDNYNGSMQQPQAGEDESAIDFGNLLPRTTKGHHRLNSRNTSMHSGDPDEEERMMDKLLMHYSKKGLHVDETKTTAGTRKTGNCDGAQTQCQQDNSVHPPGRAVSLPPESISTGEAVKVPARSTSMRPECPGSVRVHPKMPDFDELAARVLALRNA